ncbi:5-histidylcysteine sulfoxide synthase [Sulfurimonas sp. HSL1-6]|uniref:5-histidylcysteine sulfoxide synthase n=1 Tax=Thiomicrolovo immobilis TaxID=3131935 RepID=UPI0031F8D55E
MQRFHSYPVRLDGTDPQATRDAIRNDFLSAYSLFEALFGLLKDDNVFFRRSERTRHPMIFYFGHTATFFINKLVLAKVIDKRINPDFESLFAIGVDEMAWDDMDSSRYEWPGVDAVREYRTRVKTQVLELIDTLPLQLPITQESPWWVILMGIEHERIHIETSSVLHRQMPLEEIRPSEAFPYCNDAGLAPENSLTVISGAVVQLGKERGDPYYGWDNEYGSARMEVPEFRTATMLVSHGEFLPFVEAGGYEDPVYWDEEGMRFLKRSGAKHPPFWVAKAAGGYRLRLLDREIDLPMDWPVEVNCLEAQAFCRFKSVQEGRAYRLPTEAEWVRMLESSTALAGERFDDTNANINWNHFASSVPVNTFLQGGLYDVVGNVWQWTSSTIDGYTGFEPHPVYDDFSLPTFDGKHNLIKGGSWASTGNETLRHSRYAFRRHFYQHAGFRYVEADAPAESMPENIYETDSLVAQYCEFQYGPDCFGVKNFARNCAEHAVAFTASTPQKRALDLGCATGRASFELARVFDDVTGIDFSARFIQVGTALKAQGQIAYERVEEGDVTTRQIHSLEEFGLKETAGNVQFWQGDACNLKAHFSGYDLIMATNLIDRLYEPERFLAQVHERLNDGGILLLTSPYTWLEEYTQKAHWLGGYYDENGEAVESLSGLKAILSPHFELLETFDVPFVIRETARKYQHTLSQMSVWKKR